MSDELRAQANSRRWAWTLWLIAFLAVSGIILAGNRRTVTPSYRSAALKWLQSEPIYGQNGRGFVYLPQAAILYVPFAVLPETASEILFSSLHALGGTEDVMSLPAGGSAMPSSHASAALPVHCPPVHVSPTVQASPSSQDAPSLRGSAHGDVRVVAVT
jgi:hypothetical protein